jgi:hypothetical protein
MNDQLLKPFSTLFATVPACRRREFLSKSVMLLAGGISIGELFLKSISRADAQEAQRLPGVSATATLFPGFHQTKIETSGATINVLTGGSGPPLLVMHGYPQTLVEWHKVAPQLAQRFSVVLTDLARLWRQ